MNIEKLIGNSGSEFADQTVEALLRRSQRRVDNTLKRIRRPQAAVGVVNSPLGDLLVALSERGVVLIHYLPGDDDFESIIADLRLALDPVDDRRSVKEVGAEIRRYLDGDADALRRNIDLTLAQSPFQKNVLHKLRDIPRGAVVSYQALGAAAGTPKGARAVGNALHNNPVPIYVPCHRVVTSSGGIGGYGGGVARKVQLLRSEGFALGKADDKLPKGVVWGHKGTKIYCRTNCRTTARTDRAQILFFANTGEAKQAGLRPCKICRPV
ncbi:MAG: methylated-DNA--[protein]-cysteine S-methyltransferase [Candidatus Binatia bacterium]